MSSSQSPAASSPPPTSTSSPEAEAEAPYSIFDKRQKAIIVAIASTAATFSGFASNIYFPALPTIARDLGVSVELVNLTVTSYLIFQGIAPSFWGPVSDVKGRRVAYCLTFLVLLGACIGLAETRNYATLIVLRCLQSTGSASTIAIGAGVIGDITTREDRGSYMGVFQAGLLTPTAIGPVIGGALAGSLGWRAIFWFLTIYTSVFLLFLLALLPETLRSIVGNGGQAQMSPFTKFPLNFYQKLTKVESRSATASVPTTSKKIDVLGPLRILTSKFAAPTIIFLAIHYAVWQMSITAMSSLFESRYGLSETQIGLTFIANGVGSMVGTLITGKILDIDYRRVKAAFEREAPRSDDTEAARDGSSSETDPEAQFPLEKARLRLVPMFSAIQCLSILLFGWSIQFPNRVPLAIPIVSTFITGWSSVSIQSVITTYLVDIFSDRSAAATASLNLARCLFAAGGTSFIMPLINGIGVGLAFTICAIVQVAALLGVSVAWKYAGRWRHQSEQAAKLRNRSDEQQ
ncbi:major facilitator superfamily domain-containing protein [Pestalotiopsis sp. NC0098]|nr:major facilitator superfamily domain-containing protein [Pestalotiopsis sp. NC0098]